MLKMSCNSYGLCIDPASPLANISAADEDQLLFLQNWFGPNQPPPLGSHFSLTVCNGTCEADNQLDLLSCVVTKAIECAGDDSWNPIPISTPGGSYGNDNFPPIPPANPVAVFYNMALFGTTLCPDGSTFTLEYPAGLAAGFTTEQANATGQGLADQAAVDALFCLNDIDSKFCLNSDVDVVLASSGTLTVEDGLLPLGTDLDGLSLKGTALTEGEYIFTLRLSDTIDGYQCYCIREYTVNVVGITETTVPNPQEGNTYTHQLTYYAASATPTFSITDGALPAGLSLDSDTGIISGTPTVNGSFAFEVTMTDGSLDCSQNVSMTVDPAYNCMGNTDDIASLVWTVDTSASYGGFTITTAAAAGGVGAFSGSCSRPTAGDPQTAANAQFSVNLCNPTASAITLRLTLTVTTLTSNCTNPGAGLGAFMGAGMSANLGAPPQTVLAYLDSTGTTTFLATSDYTIAAETIFPLYISVGCYIINVVQAGTIALACNWTITQV